MKRQEHLSDAEIEQCANSIPGTCAEQIESHLSECEVCLHRLLELQRIQFKSIETSGMNRDPHPEFPSEDEIQNVAAGMVEPATAARILQHAAQCNRCGSLLNHYLEIFSEEAAPEIEALIDQLPSSNPGWERKKASEIAARMRPSPAPTFKTWWGSVLRPRILATAGGLAALVVPIVIFGPELLETWQINKATTLVATAYARNRTTEMRPAIVLHGPMASVGGTMGTNDGGAFFGHPEFNRARSLADDKISSGGSVSPRWYQIKGELLLLGDPAKNTMAAEDAFRAAKDKGLNDDPSLNIDLAISYFERFTHSNPPSPDKPSGASPRLLIQSTDLLNEVLSSPKATEEHKKAALFDLAIVYEKLEKWEDAEATWDKYLKMDSVGAWADEARTRREEAARHSRKSTSRISFEPDYYLAHRYEPAVLDNTEEILDKAAVPWLIDAMEHPGGLPAQAAAALANELNKHSDHLLHDLITTIRANDRPALLALGKALQANREDDVREALDNARSAIELFARTHNIAGELWARFAEVYAYQRGQSGPPCLTAATDLQERLSERAYPWLNGQVFLERAICGNFTSSADKNTDIEQNLKNSESLARRFRFPILHLRTLGAAAGIGRQRSQNCDKANTWELGLSGMKEYWNGVYPQERLFQFSSVLEQCAEDAHYWNAAKALLESSIAIRLSMDEKDRDWNMLVALYGHLAAILTSLGQETPPKIQFTSAEAKPYAAITSIFLAERQLNMGKTDAALATLESARGSIEQIGNDLVMVEFRRVTGKARLQSGQLSAAEQECEKGIEIGERYLSTLKNAPQRVEWTIKTEELYRVLTQTWLQEKRIEDAWKLWEWAKARPIFAYSSPARPSPKWAELQRDILALQVPSGPAMRLVYAVFSDRTHVWAVGRGRVRSRWIESKQEDLNQSINRFARNCADASSSIRELQEQGKALFALLLRPFQEEFSAAQVLALEMDQQLWKLPVSALRTPDDRYVAETFDVTYSPGILLEPSLRMPTPVHPQSAFLLINAWPQPTQEMIDIPRSFNKPVIISGLTANKKKVLATAALSNLMIFFGHAIAQENGVALQLNDNLVLGAADFSPKRMPNLGLVVLAACSTGKSDQSSLLDNNTLVRTFLMAGVPHVVASQWDVDSASTARLMAIFFQNSLSGQPPHLALTHAERTFLETARKGDGRDYLHPKYWAGFIVIGRADSAAPRSTSVALR